MFKKEKLMSVQQDEQNKRIQFAAMHSITDVLEKYHTSKNGLDEDAVNKSRNEYGSNKIDHEKKKSLAKE